MSEREIERTSPSELAGLPADFWNEADVVVPPPKQRSRYESIRMCRTRGVLDLVSTIERFKRLGCTRR